MTDRTNMSREQLLALVEELEAQQQDVVSEQVLVEEPTPLEKALGWQEIDNNAETPLIAIPLKTSTLEMRPDEIEGHAPISWVGKLDMLVVRSCLGTPHSFGGKVGEISLSLRSEDLNCIDLLWPFDGRQYGIEEVGVVGSLSDIVAPLLSNHYDEEDKAYALEWADHLEALAAEIRRCTSE